MKTLYIALILCLSLAGLCCAQNQSQGLLLEDFEGLVSAGPEGTVDFGAGNGSSVDATAAQDIKYSGNQSLKVTYDAVSDGYMYVAKGFGLDAKNTAWLVKPEDIDWAKYEAFSFCVYGSDSKTQVAFDIKDSGNEMWRFMFEDNFTGWKKIVCPFNAFLVRDDWQPDNADNNMTLDFPIKVFQFEPRPQAQGTLYFDRVELE
ncbi:MAG: carbohydrate binding domain-containing protein [Candidatus Omnitrophota bacterium]